MPKHEHTPHSDAQLDMLEEEGLCRALVADLREARRLLRVLVSEGEGFLSGGHNDERILRHHIKQATEYLSNCEGRVSDVDPADSRESSIRWRRNGL